MAWTPWLRVDVKAPSKEQVEYVRKILDLSVADVMRQVFGAGEGWEYYQNNIYLVGIRKLDHPASEQGILHLSIKRRDKRVIRDWRHLQRIKNELVGYECEGVELFPAESRTMDTANQYHLWVFPEESVRWPVGYTDWNENQQEKFNQVIEEHGPMPGTRQRA